MAKKFCVLTEGRSGSTSLLQALARFDDVAVPGKNVASHDDELLNPQHLARYRREYARLCGRDIADAGALVDAFYALNACSAYAGFKSMPVRDRHFAALVARADVQFIALTRRDTLSAAASFAVAHFTGSWRRRGEPYAARWRFEPARHGRWVRGNVAYVRLTHARIAQVPSAIRLSYEELCDGGTRALDEWFGRAVRLHDAKPPTSGAAVVENWDEFRAFAEQAWREPPARA
jgi:hypothetical protein